MDPNTQTAGHADEHQNDDQASNEPRTVEMPRAVSELRYGKGKKIEPKTVISRDLANRAGLDQAKMAQLLKSGAIELVEVYVG